MSLAPRAVTATIGPALTSSILHGRYDTYDLAADAAESRPLPPTDSRRSKLIDQLRAVAARTTASVRVPPRRRLDEDTKERMRALGYNDPD